MKLTETVRSRIKFLCLLLSYYPVLTQFLQEIPQRKRAETIRQPSPPGKWSERLIVGGISQRERRGCNVLDPYL